jgi:hypothetical protein
MSEEKDARQQSTLDWNTIYEKRKKEETNISLLKTLRDIIREGTTFDVKYESR